jgi:hypothetical protein
MADCPFADRRTCLSSRNASDADPREAWRIAQVSRRTRRRSASLPGALGDVSRGSVTKAAVSVATTVTIALLGCGLIGCQSHLNSQLLERELRLQEDQIYRLQDVLDEKCARLEYVVQENASLKRQLGYDDGVSSRSRGAASSVGQSSGSRGSAPALVPPTIELSDPAPPATLPQPDGPPVLEGVPPLPKSSTSGYGEEGGDAPPVFSMVPEQNALPVSPPETSDPGPNSWNDPTPDSFEEGPSFAPEFGSPQAGAPGLLDEIAQQASVLQLSTAAAGGGTGDGIRQLSYVEPDKSEAAAVAPLPADATIERIVINRDETQIMDSDGNGSVDALAVVFEPRDSEERLIRVTGDVVIEVHQAAATVSDTPVASWTIPAADAAATFRSTSRSRGLRFMLSWQGGPQPGFSGLVRVRLRSVSGGVYSAETPLSLP